MKKPNLNWLNFVFLFFIGYVIYDFKIEKSFSLLSIYIICVSYSLVCYLLNLNAKKALPVLFIVSLFVMYGISNDEGILRAQIIPFLLLISGFSLMLLILLPEYNLRLKKLATFFAGALLAAIYIIDEEGLAEYKYIPFVLGSFFMFRSISYLHEIKFLKQKAPRIDSINYFLLSPNFSMPLFPIVDYKNFITSYAGINSNTLSRGTLFIFKGVFQLILYRFIYHEIIMPFDEIKTAADVLTFIVANFMIVLRVIGAYHIAIGMIMLTGYNVPDIFNNVFFAKGFSDLWRRINMYWLNFMIKVFYYPIYFRIKNLGVYRALFISTFACFIITWFLHTYQWFWLKGFFPIEMKDMIFWGAFGLLVSINTLFQQRQLEKSGAATEKSFLPLRRALSALGVLLLMSFLWSIWTSNSMVAWWKVMGRMSNIDMGQVRMILLFIGIYLAAATFYHAYDDSKKNRFAFLKRNSHVISFGAFTILFVMLLYSKSMLHGSKHMFYRTKIEPLLTEQLNKADLLMIDNGYYTNLIATNNYSSQIWMNQSDIAGNWTKHITSQTTKPSYDLMLTRNIPNASVKFQGIHYTLNSVGLRDKEYPKAKPDSCYRIVVLGGSFECGNGMHDGEDFLSLVEEELNENFIAMKDGRRVHIEIINFSSNGYRLLQRLHHYRDEARNWNPDAVFLFIHTNYRVRIINYVNRLVYMGYDVNDPYLKEIIEKTGIEKNDGAQVVRSKLGSYADSINYYASSGISRIAREDSSELIAIYLPTLRHKNSKRDSIFMANISNWYGMKPIELNSVFDGQDPGELALSDHDYHPNKKANRLIADKLLEGILRHQDYFGIQFNKK